jgi:hypothetical protein
MILKVEQKMRVSDDSRKRQCALNLALIKVVVEEILTNR